MILFIDTETNGLPDFNKRASDKSQPHIVQLAAMLTDDQGKVLECHNVIVKPEGWSISEEMTAIHGISQELAMEVGIPETCMAEILWQMLKKQKLLVGHNLSFDKFMARIAMRRCGLLSDEEDAWWKAMPVFCTMRTMTDICKMPGKFPGQYKYPKLAEAWEFIFKKALEGTHDAMNDLIACRDVYFWLQQNAQTPKPKEGELV